MERSKLTEMLSPNQKPTAVTPDARLTPIARNPLDTTFSKEFEYRGADLQRGNRQLATFLDNVANHYQRIVEMPATHVFLVIPAVLSHLGSPIMMGAGIMTTVWGNLLAGAALVLGSLALRSLPRNPLPIEQYEIALAKIGSLRGSFLGSFQHPLGALQLDEQNLVGPLTIQYALMAVSALVPETFREPHAPERLWHQLERAALALDIQLNPNDLMGPEIIKSKQFSTDLKTLKLLSRLFDAAANFALNGFEYERQHFDQRLKDLMTHLSGSTKKYAAQEEQALRNDTPT